MGLNIQSAGNYAENKQELLCCWFYAI